MARLISGSVAEPTNVGLTPKSMSSACTDVNEILNLYIEGGIACVNSQVSLDVVH